jgi:hypothetical protein
MFGWFKKKLTHSNCRYCTATVSDSASEFCDDECEGAWMRGDRMMGGLPQVTYTPPMPPVAAPLNTKEEEIFERIGNRWQILDIR